MPAGSSQVQGQQQQQPQGQPHVQSSQQTAQATMAAAAPLGGGVVDLPLPGQKGAPKKFTGKHSDVLPFLYFYERLCQKHNVTSDQDMVESIT